LESLRLLLPDSEAIYFCGKGWTGLPKNCPTGKSANDRPIINVRFASIADTFGVTAGLIWINTRLLCEYMTTRHSKSATSTA
jgi:hypothetical protein